MTPRKPVLRSPLDPTAAMRLALAVGIMSATACGATARLPVAAGTGPNPFPDSPATACDE